MRRNGGPSLRVSGLSVPGWGSADIRFNPGELSGDLRSEEVPGQRPIDGERGEGELHDGTLPGELNPHRRRQVESRDGGVLLKLKDRPGPLPPWIDQEDPAGPERSTFELPDEGRGETDEERPIGAFLNFGPLCPTTGECRRPDEQRHELPRGQGEAERLLDELEGDRSGAGSLGPGVEEHRLPTAGDKEAQAPGPAQGERLNPDPVGPLEGEDLPEEVPLPPGIDAGPREGPEGGHRRPTAGEACQDLVTGLTCHGYASGKQGRTGASRHEDEGAQDRQPDERGDPTVYQ